MRLGIDLGGTKIEIAALDTDGTLRLRRRVPSPQGDYRASIAAIAGLVAAADAELGVRGTVGIGNVLSERRRIGGPTALLVDVALHLVGLAQPAAAPTQVLQARVGGVLRYVPGLQTLVIGRNCHLISPCRLTTKPGSTSA